MKGMRADKVSIPCISLLKDLYTTTLISSSSYKFVTGNFGVLHSLMHQLMYAGFLRKTERRVVLIFGTTDRRWEMRYKCQDRRGWLWRQQWWW
ncbi:hypothetical protein HanXRQr2_Chr07g0301961 [Helianthus annuus]|uniref:Uncharacterized protein n=1 Tax=Helianthus annuus TaxID=4232 RepID=A0A251VI75_HELAN|nr:hypothetical protein HanXRQr2_Chr07g0301961 [Helianthus annuus]KAJ0905286.1 hypothetical protein HanPSC8_Chr07g0292251 [Helianthus annuus]